MAKKTRPTRKPLAGKTKAARTAPQKGKAKARAASRSTASGPKAAKKAAKKVVVKKAAKAPARKPAKSAPKKVVKAAPGKAAKASKPVPKKAVGRKSAARPAPKQKAAPKKAVVKKTVAKTVVVKKVVAKKAVVKKPAVNKALKAQAPTKSPVRSAVKAVAKPPVAKAAPPVKPAPAPKAPAKPVSPSPAKTAPSPAPAPTPAPPPAPAPAAAKTKPKTGKVKEPIQAVMTGVDPLSGPSRLTRRATKERFVVEHYLRTSIHALYDMISTPSGFSEWFCDDVNVRGDEFAFVWGPDVQLARCIGRKFGELMRFHWEEDDDPGSYFELRIRIDPMTNDVALVVTDHAWPKDLPEARALWESQVANLARVLGA